MDTLKLEQIGYFDRIFIDGTIKPMNIASGLTVKNKESLTEAIENDSENYMHDIAKLRLEILGESIEGTDKDEKEQIKEDRFENGIKMINKSGNIERYIIAYADILILKGKHVFPFKKNDNNIEDYCVKSDVKLDNYQNYIAAVNIAREIAKREREEVLNINIAMIDKVYVYQAFRECGISSWIHDNLIEILKVYGMVRPHGVVLTYGDFTKQSLITKNYIEFLKNHYKNHGYTELEKDKRKRYKIDSNSIMYKIISK